VLLAWAVSSVPTPKGSYTAMAVPRGTGASAEGMPASSRDQSVSSAPAPAGELRQGHVRSLELLADGLMPRLRPTTDEVATVRAFACYVCVCMCVCACVCVSE